MCRHLEVLQGDTLEFHFSDGELEVGGAVVADVVGGFVAHGLIPFVKGCWVELRYGEERRFVSLPLTQRSSPSNLRLVYYTNDFCTKLDYVNTL